MENLVQSEIAKSLTDLHKGQTLTSSQEKAVAFIKEVGLPTKNHEAWIYTSIAKTIAPKMLKPLDTELAQDLQNWKSLSPNFIILSNGRYLANQAQHSDKITIEELQNEDETFFDYFHALNSATKSNLLLITIKEKSHINHPLIILNLVDEICLNKINSPRIKVKIEREAKVEVIEWFTSTHNSLFQYSTNSVVEFQIEENAHLTHLKIQDEALKATHIGLNKFIQSNHSQVKSLTLNLGSLVSRNNLQALLGASGAECEINGLALLNEQQHSDQFTEIHHQVSYTQSRQLFKAIASDEGHAIFTGKVVVHPKAIQINSEQLCRGLLLTKKAHIHSRPQLEVYADDVKCAHGAAIGQLSNEEEFYLQSRGISKSRAKAMLLNGFAQEVTLNYLSSQSTVGAKIQNAITEKLKIIASGINK